MNQDAITYTNYFAQQVNKSLEYRHKDLYYEHKFISKFVSPVDQYFNTAKLLYLEYNRAIFIDITITKNKKNFETIGKDCLVHIASYLLASSINKLSQVSKYCRNCLNHSELLHKIKKNPDYHWNKYYIECLTSYIFRNSDDREFALSDIVNISVKKWCESRKFLIMEKDLCSNSNKENFGSAIQNLKICYEDYIDWCFDNDCVPICIESLEKEFNEKKNYTIISVWNGEGFEYEEFLIDCDDEDN